MHDFEQEDPIPQGDLALQITALPRETNGFGDIFGGWLVAQMDLAGTAMASKVAGGRVATVAIDRMAFLVPVAVGAQLSFYTQTVEVGRSSIQMLVEVWRYADNPHPAGRKNADHLAGDRHFFWLSAGCPGFRYSTCTCP